MSMIQVINNELNTGWDGFRSTAIGRYVIVEFGAGMDTKVMVFVDKRLVGEFQFDCWDEEHYWDHYRFIVEATK